MRRNRTIAPIGKVKFAQNGADGDDTVELYPGTTTTATTTDTLEESQGSQIGAMIIRRRYWEQKSIISKQHKIGFFSLVALICVFAVLTMWYWGLIPGIPDGWYRYGIALFYVSLVVYIIGAGVVFSERIEFYLVICVLHVGALILNALVWFGILWSYITCIDGTSTTENCVYPYITDAIVLTIVSILTLSGAVTAFCLTAMIWAYRRVKSYRPMRRKRA
jgi:hypothetical protein